MRKNAFTYFVGWTDDASFGMSAEEAMRAVGAYGGRFYRHFRRETQGWAEINGYTIYKIEDGLLPSDFYHRDGTPISGYELYLGEMSHAELRRSIMDCPNCDCDMELEDGVASCRNCGYRFVVGSRARQGMEVCGMRGRFDSQKIKSAGRSLDELFDYFLLAAREEGVCSESDIDRWMRELDPEKVCLCLIDFMSGNGYDWEMARDALWGIAGREVTEIAVGECSKAVDADRKDGAMARGTRKAQRTGGYELLDTYGAPQGGVEEIRFDEFWELEEYLDEHPDVAERIEEGYAIVKGSCAKRNARKCAGGGTAGSAMRKASRKGSIRKRATAYEWRNAAGGGSELDYAPVGWTGFGQDPGVPVGHIEYWEQPVVAYWGTGEDDWFKDMREFYSLDEAKEYIESIFDGMGHYKESKAGRKCAEDTIEYGDYDALVYEALDAVMAVSPSWHSYGSPPARVEVDKGYGGHIRGVNVNWSGCGTQSIEDTREFAEFLLKVCDIAEDLGEQVAGKRIVYVDDEYGY